LFLRIFWYSFITTVRWFKKVVYQTNHIKVEKLLLEHECLQQSIQLILMNTWENDEFVITDIIKNLYHNCSSFFDILLSRFKQESLCILLTTECEDENDEIILQHDSEHKQVIATDHLKSRYCKEVLWISIRTSDFLMIMKFKLQLREIFAKDYNLSNVMYFEAQTFQWCKKITFTFRWTIQMW